ncbi:MAG TPA: hypothetical protein VGO93_04030 [Candidatus Xenobia bacterium]|jgi:hypothetical protein
MGKAKSKAPQNPATILILRYIEENLQAAPRPTLLRQMLEDISKMRSAAPAAIVHAIVNTDPASPDAAVLARLIVELGNPRLDQALDHASEEPLIADMRARLGRVPVQFDELADAALASGKLPTPCPPRLALTILQRLDDDKERPLPAMVRELTSASDPKVRRAAASLEASRGEGRLSPPDPGLGHMGPPVANGLRRLNLAWQRPHRKVLVAGVACSDDGIQEVSSLQVSADEWRLWRRDQELVAYPAGYIRQRIHELVQVSLAADPSFEKSWKPKAYLFGEPPSPVLPHPVYELIDPATVDPESLATSNRLGFEVGEVADLAWADEIVDSATLEMLDRGGNLDNRAMEALHEAIAREAVQRIGPELRARLALRVEDVAYVLEKTHRSTAARQALAVAQALRGEMALEDIPFMVELMKCSMAVTGDHLAGHPCDHEHHGHGHAHHRNG